MVKNLYIQMLGDFSISTKDKKISDIDNRSRKLWLLLAYIIYHRHRVVLQEECINLLWGEGESGVNPAGAFKTVLHRLRNMLAGLWPKAGHDLILRQNGGYIWNKEVITVLDIEAFDHLSHKGDYDKEEQIQRDFHALQLYGGDFLAHMSSEVWVIPIAAYYHNCYMQSLLRVLPVLLEQKRYSEAAELCQIASNVEPFHEGIHSYLMQALLCMGDHKGAVNIYKKISERLYSNLGIMPSEEMRALYDRAIRINNDKELSMDAICEQLQEADAKEGALICDYDSFRVLYRFMARSMARNGMTIQVALLSITTNGEKGVEFSLKKQQRIMKSLKEQIRMSLRSGDTASQCSVSQYVLLLPQANYENGCMVCERIVNGFLRKCPHADVVIQYTVCPVVPSNKKLDEEVL